MIVAPFNSKLNISAHFRPPDGPVVLHRYQASKEEIIVFRFYHQYHWITCQYVFLTHWPCHSFHVYLVSVASMQTQHSIILTMYSEKTIEKSVPSMKIYTCICMQLYIQIYITCSCIALLMMNPWTQLSSLSPSPDESK